MAQPPRKTIYTGTFIDTPYLDALRVSEHLAIGVDAKGVICHKAPLNTDDSGFGASSSIDEREQVKALAVEWGWGEDGWQWVKGGRQGSSWWFPGFVDTHIHASQFPNSGLFGKSTLLDWLEKYTYPMESSLSSPEKAWKVYDACVARTLSHGTTTASYYATLHAATTNILADICQQKGQRAFVGRVCMDTDLSPKYYRDESPDFSMRETEAVIEHINRIDPTHDLLCPILTPRFAPSCTTSLLSKLGDLANKSQLPIQTHISENLTELELVKKKFPSHASYTDIYASFNLLTPRTILAHGIHLTLPELDLIASHKSCISHCPVSNTSLSSGLCPVRKLLSHNITVGLGTDVSGGYSPSILVAAREAGMVSRTLAAVSPETDTDRNRKKLSVEECLYLATRGGARCLGLGHTIGAFEIGTEWDAQLISLHSVGGESDPVSPAPQPSSQAALEGAMEKSAAARRTSNNLTEAFTSIDDAATAGNATQEQKSTTISPSQLDKPAPTTSDVLSEAFTNISEATTNSSVTQPSLSKVKTPVTPPPPSSSIAPFTEDSDPGPVDLWGSETWAEKVAKWVFCGDDRNTRQVYVKGRLVHERH